MQLGASERFASGAFPAEEMLGRSMRLTVAHDDHERGGC